MNYVDTVMAADRVVARALNTVAALPFAFNRLIVLISEANYLKIAPFVLIAVWFWNAGARDLYRRKVAAGFVGIFLALAVGRALQLNLPFRARPIYTEDLGLALPGGMSPDMLGGWSSFPSDHAVLFGALVGLTWALSRRLGKLGLLYAVVFVLLPRLYIGVHFLSDIVAGFSVGLAISWLVQLGFVSRVLSYPILPLTVRYPAIFYTSAFFLLTELVQMFGDVRRYASIAKGVWIGTL